MRTYNIYSHDVVLLIMTPCEILADRHVFRLHCEFMSDYDETDERESPQEA